MYVRVSHYFLLPYLGRFTDDSTVGSRMVFVRRGLGILWKRVSRACVRKKRRVVNATHCCFFPGMHIQEQSQTTLSFAGRGLPVLSALWYMYWHRFMQSCGEESAVQLLNLLYPILAEI